MNPQYTKANDDGEPTNTAGKPILSVLEGAQLHNVLLIVTRYFGGTLLGVGGLIQAYTETAKQTIANAPLINAEITKTLEITYAYDKTAQISHLISKYQAKILAEERGEQVKETLEVNYDFYEKITQEISLI
ncbi:YigZ family protein [bacterium]|nr:YigZ family protein [bacterium]